MKQYLLIYVQVLLEYSGDEKKKKSTLKKQHGSVIAEKVLLQLNLMPMCPSSSIQPLQIACLDSKTSSL